MSTTLSAPLPDLDLEHKSILRVEAGDPSGVITGVVIHFSQEVPEQAPKIDLIPPPLAHRHGPGET